MLETIDLIGNFNILFVGGNLNIIEFPQNLPEEYPVGHKREYSCDDMLVLIFLNTF